jgi:phospholipase/lecithinase/hemolysin
MIDYKSVRLFGALAALAVTAACSVSAGDFTAIVAFGDSYTDTGRSPSSPPDYYDGRFSNGPLWIEYLSQTLGFDYNADNNYAVSGTESDELGVAIAKFPGTKDSSGVLFAIWSGNNDFQGHLDEGANDTYWNGSVTHTVTSLTDSCSLLYAKGARNVVLFNQIDITRLPIFRENYSTDYGAYIRGKINDVNSRLQSALGPLLSGNPGLQIYVVDAYDDFNALLANYVSYGFTDDTIGAINDPNLANISFTGPGADYVFWDDQHPTTKTHDLISGWVANTLGSGSASSDLTVQIQGEGSVSPNYNGKLLHIGKSYSATAVPAANYLFSSWTATGSGGSATSTSNPLRFVMGSGMLLTANFVTNNFLKAAGSYNGLFSVGATDVTEDTAGQLRNFRVSPRGVFSGLLLIGGRGYSLSGRFNADGTASVNIPRPRPAGPLLLQLALNWDVTPCQLSGSVSGTNGGSWSADLTAELAGNELPSGAFTMLLPPPSAESSPGPTGYGYAAIANHNGAVTLSGALADGTVFSQSVAVSTTGDVPVCVNLYSRAGLLLGWLNLANDTPGGSLVWIKPDTRISGADSPGFTSSVQVLLSPWTKPAPGQAAIPLSDGQLDISGPGGLAPQLSFSVEVNTKNQLIKLPDGSPTNSLAGSINPNTGVWTIAFGNGTGRATTHGRGVFLQNTANAGGFFVGSTGAGSITLAPTPP